MWPSPYLDAFGEEVCISCSIRRLNFDLVNGDINHRGIICCCAFISAAVHLLA